MPGSVTLPGDQLEQKPHVQPAEAYPLTITGTHGETITITDDFEPHGVLDGELLVRVNGPKGGSKYRLTISRRQLAALSGPGDPVPIAGDAAEPDRYRGLRLRWQGPAEAAIAGSDAGGSEHAGEEPSSRASPVSDLEL